MLPLLVLGAALAVSAAQADSPAYGLRTRAGALPFPVSLACLQEERFLVALRGSLLLIDGRGRTGRRTGGPLARLADDARYIDVAIDSAFKDNGFVYLSHTDGPPERNGVSVVRARLAGGKLVDARRILRTSPDKATPFNNAGRILALPGGDLFVSVGDGIVHREAAQSWDSELGKVLRIQRDGTAAGVGGPENSDTLRIWALGLRHPTAMAYSAVNKAVFIVDEGPGGGGDELNVLQAGGNYGWPLVSHGLAASGALVTPFRTAPTMIDPLWVWPEGIAPVAMAAYDRGDFGEWRSSLLVASAHGAIYRMGVVAETVVTEERVLERIREPISDLRVCGERIYVLTAGAEGRLLEVRR